MSEGFRGLFGLSDSSNSGSDSEIGDSFMENGEASDVIESNDGVLVHSSQDCDISINLKQNKMLGIAHQLWPAATYLCNYLERQYLEREVHDGSKEVHDGSKEEYANILELGAGIGLCGIYAHQLFQARQTIVTDLEDAMDIINENIELNRDQSSSLREIEAQVLSWGDMGHVTSIMDRFADNSHTDTASTSLDGEIPPPLVLIADCVYWENLFEPLVQTIRCLVLHYKCTVLMAYVKRWKKCSKFFQMLRKKDVTRDGHLTDLKYVDVELMDENIVWEVDSFTKEDKKHIYRLYRIRGVTEEPDDTYFFRKRDSQKHDRITDEEGTANKAP